VVDVPAGVEEGSTLRLADHGAAGQRGAPNGSSSCIWPSHRTLDSSATGTTCTPR